MHGKAYVVSNHSHGMTVDTELLHPLGTGVDQAQTVDFVGAEPEVGNSGIASVTLGGIAGLFFGAVEGISAVDQVVV